MRWHEVANDEAEYGATGCDGVVPQHCRAHLLASADCKGRRHHPQRVEGLGSRRHTLRHLFAKTVKNLL